MLYILPLLGACSVNAELPYPSVPQALEISFVERSWSLSVEQMRELRRFRNAVPSGATVSLETCEPGSPYFSQNRLRGIRTFLTQGNPLEVTVELCESSSPQNKVYVSVVGYGSYAVADAYEEP